MLTFLENMFKIKFLVNAHINELYREETLVSIIFFEDKYKHLNLHFLIKV